MFRVCATGLHTRKNFLGVSGGLVGVGALTACGGSGVNGMSAPGRLLGATQPLAFSDTPAMQELLTKNGLLAVRENGIAIVRDDMKTNPAFVKRATRPFIVLCGCATGGDGDSDGGLSVEFDGIPLGFSSSVSTTTGTFEFGGYGTAYGGDSDFLTGLIAPGDTPLYGAEYSAAGSFNDASCVESEMETIIAAAGAFYAYMKNLIDAGKADPQVRALYLAYTAGELTAWDLVVGALAALGLTVCAEALVDAGIGIAIGSLLFGIWDTAKCVFAKG
jgi:hypothetical protein